jgi:NADH dehydrogenase [ubiquinone] 1 alpha subcomplex assembly factor 2
VGEQREDVVRRERMKILAAEADARWEAKPRMMDAPGEAKGQPAPALEGAGMRQTQTGKADEPPSQGEAYSPPTERQRKEEEKDPWAQAKARGPSEKWQPEAWTPTPGKK